jgi:hypothetical protein
MKIKKQLIYLLANSLVALSFSAYAADKPKEPIKTVAIIEARELPVEFDISLGFWRHFIPYGVAGGINGSSSAFIYDAMPKIRAEKYDPSGILNRAVITALEDAGIKVSVIKDLERSESRPNNVKYSQVKHDADALMHLAINYYVMQLPKGQQLFWPRVDSWISIYDKVGKNEIFGTSASHSWDYKDGKDPGYFNVSQDMTFASEEAMVENPKKFADAFNQIMKIQAEYMVQDLLKQWPK